MRRWGRVHPAVTDASVEADIAAATTPFATKADLETLTPKTMLSDYAKLADLNPLVSPVFRFYAAPSLLVVGTVPLWATSANRPFKLKRLIVRLSTLTSGTLAGALKLNGTTVQTFSLTPSAKVQKYVGATLAVSLVEDDYLSLVVTGIGVGQGDFSMTLETSLP